MQVRHAWYSDDMHGVSPGKKEQPMAAFVYVNSDSRNAVCVLVDGWLRSLRTRPIAVRYLKQGKS